MVEPLHDILSDLYYEDHNGEIQFNRSMSVGELRKAMVYDSTDPEGIEDAGLSELVFQLSTSYPCVLVTVYDEENPHLRIVDRHENSVSTTTLERMQDEGYEVIEAGADDYEYKDDSTHQHAFAEFKRQ